MTIFRILFSFKGRINRGQFWFASMLQVLLLVLFMGAFAATVGKTLPADFWARYKLWAPIAPQDMNGYIPIYVMIALMVYTSAAMYTKRYHDRNKGPIWLLMVYVPAFAPMLHPMLGLFSMVMTSYVLYEMGCLRGTDGPNRFDLDDECDEGAAYTSFLPAATGSGSNWSNLTSAASPEQQATAYAAMPPFEPTQAHTASQSFGRLNNTGSSGFGRRGL
jgi:uncharacterized membrane protein YhaH (DUF805 family)